MLDLTGMPRVKIVVWREMPASVVRLQRQLLSMSPSSSSFLFFFTLSSSSSSLSSDNNFFSALSTPCFCNSEQFLKKSALNYLKTMMTSPTPGQYNSWPGRKSQLANKEANAKGLQVGGEVVAALKAVQIKKN